MALAKVWRRFIAQSLRRIPNSWPFNDRVLVWLLPNLRSDVAKFHSSNGPAMDQMFRDFQLKRMDGDLAKKLADQADSLKPGVVNRLLKPVDSSLRSIRGGGK